MSDTKITITGTTVTFVSPHTLEELKRVSKYQPSSLCLHDGDRIDFAIFTGSGTGSIDSGGITYCATTPDGKGNACVSIPLPDCEGKDAATVVSEVFGPEVVKANRVEMQVDAALAEVSEMLTKVQTSITIN